MAITPLPTPPQRTMTPAVFVPTADAFIAALPQFVTDCNATASTMTTQLANATTQATNSASSATASANSAAAAAVSATAAASASGAAAWNASTNYSQGTVVYSPITFQSYRRKVAGTTATDPSQDVTNWQLLAAPFIFQTKTANYTANPSDLLMCNTTGGSFTITLPSGLSAVGTAPIKIADYARTFNINNLIINPNGNPIEGISGNMTISTTGASLNLALIDATVGWKLV